jgi:2-dehydropantoate 2-reductase
MRFVQAGLDVTMLARDSRLTELRENGLRYDNKGIIKAVPIKVIEKLRDDDVYDFIFVPVRCDQMVSALTAIRNNQSDNILTLTNTVGYDDWTAIIGDRLIPGFPGAGGDIKDGIVSGQFGKKVQGTILGEINGAYTERIKQLGRIFDAAGLPYEISENIRAFHLSHAAFAAVMKHFYTPAGIMDAKTARNKNVLRNVASDLKENVRLLEEAGIPVSDPKTRLAGKLPAWTIIATFRIMLRMRFTRGVLLGNHALAAKEENMRMDRAFRERAFTKQS